MRLIIRYTVYTLPSYWMLVSGSGSINLYFNFCYSVETVMIWKKHIIQEKNDLKKIEKMCRVSVILFKSNDKWFYHWWFYQPYFCIFQSVNILIMAYLLYKSFVCRCQLQDSVHYIRSDFGSLYHTNMTKRIIFSIVVISNCFCWGSQPPPALLKTCYILCTYNIYAYSIVSITNLEHIQKFPAID